MTQRNHGHALRQAWTAFTCLPRTAGTLSRYCLWSGFRSALSPLFFTLPILLAILLIALEKPSPISTVSFITTMQHASQTQLKG